jgi:3-hydroxyisobutyrate dehydrogenase-like beta-hydroxyacid dehydrogenase
VAAAGLVAAHEPADVAAAVSRAEVLLSAVTPGQALPVAEAVAPYLAPGALYVDFNSIDSATAVAVAAVVGAAGGRPVDAAILGAVPLLKLAVPIALAGTAASDFHLRAQSLGLNTWVLSNQAGQASALKMLWSVMTKGTIGLLAEALIAAQRLDLLEPMRRLLAQEYGATGSDAMVLRMLRSTMRSGARRLDEMAAARRTLEAAGVPSWTVDATRRWIEVLAAMASAGEASSTEEVVHALSHALAAYSKPVANG